jgi:undecaprenyl-diphosphatase
MGLLEILILSVVQGVTEFLPVSSSGHLVVSEALLKHFGRSMPPELVEVNIVLHLGTLLAVLVYYRRRIGRLLGEDRRVMGLLIVGTLPAVIVGLPLKELAPQVLEDPLLTGILFPVTAAMLIWSSRREPGGNDYTELGLMAAVMIGAWQAFAILPGISRSGSTIVAGLAMGLRRDSAATFAFLLAIPAIAGAGVLEGLDMLHETTPATPLAVLGLGMFVSFLVGLAALALLVRLVQGGRLAYFAFWLIPLGVSVTVWQLGQRL